MEGRYAMRILAKNVLVLAMVLPASMAKADGISEANDEKWEEAVDWLEEGEDLPPEEEEPKYCTCAKPYAKLWRLYEYDYGREKLVGRYHSEQQCRAAGRSRNCTF
jgi:hypothetical protein